MEQEEGLAIVKGRIKAATNQWGRYFNWAVASLLSHRPIPRRHKLGYVSLHSLGAIRLTRIKKGVGYRVVRICLHTSPHRT